MKLKVLLVEDNDGDVFLVHEALRTHGLEYEMDVLGDGLEVERYIERLIIAPDAVRPDVVLLDLNVPRADGHDILKTFRSLPACAEVPVIVLTSSDSTKDRKRAELLGATAYFRKPLDLDEFLSLGEIVKGVAGTK